MPSVAIVGASTKPDRPSHLAVLRYRDAGWVVYPVNPAGEPVAGIASVRTLGEVTASLDIVCLYVNPTIGRTLVDTIAAMQPKLVWLNPGTEDADLVATLTGKGLKVVQACNLVALAQGDPLVLGLKHAG